VNWRTLGSRQIRLAYRDSAPDSVAAPPVVLVHGSPGTGEVFQKLTAILSPHFRVIAPDLPGFGFSTHDLPDYSFGAHGLYLIELLDALHIGKAQWVGFSMGGGVVLSAADLAPERIASIVMLSAIGVQEHELLGSYRAIMPCTARSWQHYGRSAKEFHTSVSSTASHSMSNTPETFMIPTNARSARS